MYISIKTVVSESPSLQTLFDSQLILLEIGITEQQNEVFYDHIF